MTSQRLKFGRLAGKFAVCRLAADAPIPAWATSGVFTSVTRTADELSIVCPLENVPQEHKPEVPWICFKLEGPFDLLQGGILASFIDPLAKRGIPIFAIATYDTDYVLIREDFADVALGALRDAGHELRPRDEARRTLIE
ncbi:MAG: ACT domain-containing protein [Acidobacteriia bacterium]|nr:ACT domain-containing protein [Terriglobia bacterium]